MSKHEKLVKDIIKTIGGQDNISSVYHCVTRLRFKLNDSSIVEDEKVKKITGVLGVAKGAGQYQIIIGNHVPEVFKELCEITGIDYQTTVQQKEKKSVLGTIQKFMFNAMMPIFPILTASGIILGLVALLTFEEIGILTEGSGLHLLLDGAGNALFMSIPIFVAYSIAKYMGSSPMTGMLLGAALVVPSLQNLPDDTYIWFINIGGLSYRQTIIPIIFIMLAAAPLEIWLNKVIHPIVRGFTVPLIVLLVMFPLGFAIIGPFAQLIGDGILTGLNAVIGVNPIIAAFLLAGIWETVVMFGMHHAIIAVVIVELFESSYGSQIGSFFSVVPFSTVAVVFVVWLKTKKDKKLKNEIALPGFITAFLGVTEPAVFSVTLPRLKVYLSAAIGAAVGAAYMAISGATLYNWTGAGVFLSLGFLNEAAGLSNFVNAIIAYLITMGIAGALAFILYKEGDSLESQIVATK